MKKSTKKFQFNEVQVIASMSQYNTPLCKDIGRKVRFFQNEKIGSIANTCEFEIRGVQKIFDGSLAYRVYRVDGQSYMSDGIEFWFNGKTHITKKVKKEIKQYEPDTFGRPAVPSEIYFLDELQTA